MGNKIATIPYDEVDFIWVTTHWDLHLNGICNYNGKICEFITTIGSGHWKDEFIDDHEHYNYIVDSPDMCEIYSLSESEKRRWLKNKKEWEIGHGYHWSYNHTEEEIKLTRMQKLKKWFESIIKL